MYDSQIEALKIRWYNLAIAGEAVKGDDEKLFNSLSPKIQNELKHAYLLGVEDENETWMKQPQAKPEVKLIF